MEGVVPSPRQKVVIVFYALQLVGGALFALISISALIFSSQVKRHPIWHNFFLSFVVYSVSYSLLAFDPELEHETLAIIAKKKVCIAQAILVYAAPLL